MMIYVEGSLFQTRYFTRLVLMIRQEREYALVSQIKSKVVVGNTGQARVITECDKNGASAKQR